MHKQTIKSKQVVEAQASKTTKCKKKEKMASVVAKEVNEENI